MGKKTLVCAVNKCTKCSELSANRTMPVIGDGPIPCPIVFLGESPGFNEDQTGIPFCGMSGTLLESSALRAGLRRKEDYHILNVLKCRPPKNRDPLQEELDNCKPFLDQQLRVIRPKVVVALGRFAQAYILNANFTHVYVTDNMGNVIHTPHYYAVLSCHPRFSTVSPEILQAFRHHITTAKRIAEGE